MISFFEWLEEELDAVDEFKEPDSPVGENEEVLGEMDDDLRRLHSVYHAVPHELYDRMLELRREYPNHDDLPDELRDELWMLKQRSDLVRNLFWYEMRRAFGPHSIIGVREGFKAVTWEEESSPVSLGSLVIDISSLFAEM